MPLNKYLLPFSYFVRSDRSDSRSDAPPLFSDIRIICKDQDRRDHNDNKDRKAYQKTFHITDRIIHQLWYHICPAFLARALAHKRKRNVLHNRSVSRRAPRHADSTDSIPRSLRGNGIVILNQFFGLTDQCISCHTEQSTSHRKHEQHQQCT